MMDPGNFVSRQKIGKSFGRKIWGIFNLNSIYSYSNRGMSVVEMNVHGQGVSEKKSRKGYRKNVWESSNNESVIDSRRMHTQTSEEY